MKVFFFIGRNDRNKSGTSCKIWKIERKGRTVRRLWGPATWDKRARRAVPSDGLREVIDVQPTVEEARTFEEYWVSRRLSRGYERNPRRRR